MPFNNLSNQPSQLRELRDLSSYLGANPLLIQASTGNTSIKLGDTLWIKASGKWLIHSDADDFLVPVNLARATRCLRENLPIPETEPNSSGESTASIETAMHVVLPRNVVVHVHSVNAIAWAVREDGPRQLSTRLSGLPWQWIAYTPSGPALARKIQQALSSSLQPDIFVLGNHGLVVSADTCCAAAHLLSEVEYRLAIDPRPALPAAPLLRQRALSGSALCLPASTGVHSLACDPVSRRILAGGVLYPCQAIFLSASAQLFHLYEDQGVLCTSHITPAEQQTLIGLSNVVRRIDASAPLRYLTTSELAAVLNAETDSYRRTANTNSYSELLTGS